LIKEHSTPNSSPLIIKGKQMKEEEYIEGLKSIKEGIFNIIAKAPTPEMRHELAIYILKRIEKDIGIFDENLKKLLKEY
tara:strand:+ start:299 stop:535 length:237 start_codon:yes stop_codon:yes gene_type:complete